MFNDVLRVFGPCYGNLNIFWCNLKVGDFYYDNRNESFKVHFKRRAAFDAEKLLPSRIDFEKNA